MGALIAIAAGGALGSLARHGVTRLFENLLGAHFPYGILFSNVVGSALLGVAFVLVVEKALLPEFWRPLVMVGFLGGFTTFSTFSLQTVGLAQEGRLAAAALYALGSVALSIAGALAGILLTRLLTR